MEYYNYTLKKIIYLVILYDEMERYTESLEKR